jgi:hypothetical protein
MDHLGRKLQYKENFNCLVLNKPDDWIAIPFPFETKRSNNPYDLELVFMRDKQILDKHLSVLTSEKDDRIQWVAYPKKTSPLYIDLDRDRITHMLRTFAYRPVTMVSLTDDWSAMRIRNEKMVKRLAGPSVSMPVELTRLWKECPECLSFFNSLSNTNRKEYVQWINSAVRLETKEKRLEKIKQLLQDKVPNPFVK